ncbi:DUF2993 domain-containing protein [Scytonema sp. UIC 10036]|uniref:LmeA family phospholipid-binding protein n=1 Tax=Scytonema sp. UIC 10036 TaxID=2304196 RepID=UPI0012DA4105|nr:DUF2993 domain-containing protein [Scytonema sp. UIC 10036]MUG98433.1 DUF2993 domain-containing protein [Scytonema sp. UIC 10036]
MLEQQKIEEQMLSQVAEKTLSQQMDSVDKIEVDVQTDLLKIIQGEVDGVSVAGRGLVIKNIRLQELVLQTDGVSVNPLSALFGQVELNKPVNATARVVLTEADINNALKSNYIRSQMQDFYLNVDDRIVTLKPQEIQIYLPGSGKMTFNGKILVQDRGKTQSICFAAMVSPRTQDKPVMLENFNCTEGEGIALDIVVALMEKVKELLALPYFVFDDMALRVKEMKVQKESLRLLVEAYVKNLPSAQ